MSKKYIAQINNQNFIFPNNYLAEYDTNIIHDINDNTVTGVISNFNTVLSDDFKSLTISYDYEWFRNGAEPFILSDGSTSLTSFHLMQGTSFFKPTQLLWFTSVTGSTPDSYYNSVSNTETYDSPDQQWVEGDYYYEVRFIGHRAIYPIQGKFTLKYPIIFSGATSLTSASDACSNPDAPYYPFRITNSGTSMCDNSILRSPYIDLHGGSATYFWIYDGNNNVREWQILLSGEGYYYAVPYSSCSGCPGVTPTPTPTPTATPTPSTSISVQVGTTPSLCNNTPINVYSSTNDIRYGAILYSDSSLLYPLTGYNYVADSSGSIYNLNNTNGVVGSHTSYNC